MSAHTSHPTSGSAPTPWRGDEAARGSCKVDSKAQRLTSSREIRVLRAVLDGPIRREHLDRAAGASNSPDVVMRLKRNFGLRITCDTSQPVIDRDGRKAYPGIYSLHPDDRAKAIQLLLGDTTETTEREVAA